jgi:release factor glutamine methyltransferase
MDIRAELKSAKTALRQVGGEEIDAEILLAHTLGITRMELHNAVLVERTLAAISDLSEVHDQYDQAINRRVKGEPVQYITGKAYFADLELEVGPGVFIPRPETELMIEPILNHINNLQQSAVSVVELGAGSGALSIAIAAQSDKSRVIAVEKSEAAVEWLKRNIAKNEVDVRVIQGDVFDSLVDVKCDVVMANPPYVPNEEVLPAEVVDFEPHIALFGGDDGLALPRTFITAAARLLKSGGLLVLEHGEEQSDALVAVMADNFLEVIAHRDLNDRPRWISAIRR